jgi:hypothetical protein
MIEAGLVATGMQGFWVRAVVGIVFLAAVIFHLSMDQPQRLARVRQMLRFGGKLERQPAPPARERPLSPRPSRPWRWLSIARPPRSANPERPSRSPGPSTWPGAPASF